MIMAVYLLSLSQRTNNLNASYYCVPQKRKMRKSFDVNAFGWRNKLKFSVLCVRCWSLPEVAAEGGRSFHSLLVVLLKAMLTIVTMFWRFWETINASWRALIASFVFENGSRHESLLVCLMITVNGGGELSVLFSSWRRYEGKSAHKGEERS